MLNRYRKIPGDKCEGGVRPPRREDVFKKLCGNDTSTTSSNSHTKTSVSGPFLMTIIIHYTVAKRVKSLIMYVTI